MFKSGGIGKGKFKKGDQVLIDEDQLATVLDMELASRTMFAPDKWHFYKLVTPAGKIEYSHEEFLTKWKP